MTWSEHFENQLKSPPIGTTGWYGCIAGEQLAEATRLVTCRRPVLIQEQPSNERSKFLVVFDGTEFIAGGFDERENAEGFAYEWNHRS